MGQLFYGSIDLTTLIEEAKKKHSAFTKGNNGKIYASVNIWLNDNEDKFGNIMSVQISPSKQMKDVEKRIYIGNLKESEGPKQISDRDASGLDTNLDIAEREPSGPRAGEHGASEPIDDLPF